MIRGRAGEQGGSSVVSQGVRRRPNDRRGEAPAGPMRRSRRLSQLQLQLPGLEAKLTLLEHRRTWRSSSRGRRSWLREPCGAPARGGSGPL